LAISIVTPEYVSVAVTNARSCRNVSRTETSNAQPEPFFELELDLARVHEAELAMWMLAAYFAVSLHRRATVRAGLHDGNAIEDAMVAFAVRLECLEDEPLIGMLRTDLTPPHALR
jgi:hypothetical protein